MKHSIAPLDLMWLLMETQAAPTHVGALLLFDKPGGRPHVVREIVDAYRTHTPTPPFNLVPRLGGGAGLPHFEEAVSFDAGYHVQHLALPEGASYEDLLRLVADLHEPMLDRGRPLFRDWFIDGVPENRFALFTKVHHSITDGVSGLRRLLGSFSTSPRRRVPLAAFATEAPALKTRPPKPLVDRLAELGLTATRQSRAWREVSVGALRKGLASLVNEVPVGSAPFTAHRGPMNEPLQMARSFATLSLPLEEMHEVGNHYGATLNDLAVALVDEGLHRYLRRSGHSFPHSLVAFCPVSLRDAGDAGAGTKASAMFVHLGDPRATVVDRLGQVVAALNAGKQELRAMGRDAAMMYAVSLLGMAELASVTGVDNVAPPLANMVISNVPGGRERLYLNGAPLVNLFPVSAIAMSVGLNVTLASYHRHVNFGFVADGTQLSDLPRLAADVADAYAELRAATGAKGQARSARRARIKS